MSVTEISKAIECLGVRERAELLKELSARLMNPAPDDLAWLKLAEPSFQFWDHPDDAVYDQL